MLLPWGDAALIALVLAVASRAVRRSPARAARIFGPLAWETAIVLALYACWMKSADWAVTRAVGATGHGLWVWRVERDLHLPSELWVQRLVLPHPLLAQAANGFYAVVHVPALIAFLLWLYFRHPTQYAKWRNVGAVLTGACLLIQMVPVAPPRLLPQLGFVDTALRYGQSVYGSGGIKIAPQLAAMPSVHVGWAVFIAVAVITVSPSRWRWLILAHPVVTTFAVVATANHWFLDGIVAAALLPVAMGVEAAGAAAWARWGPPAGRADRAAAEDRPVPARVA
jgi:hypothetical protein